MPTKEYYRTHREHIISMSKEWYKKHKKQRNCTVRKKHQENREQYNAYMRKWRHNNRDLVNITFKKQYYQNSNFRMISILRNRIRSVLNGDYKSVDTLELLGCSIEDLKVHLQQTAISNGYLDFDINNYFGKEYHIDHIVPCARFNMKDINQQKTCFHWTNLQILKAKDNQLKGSS